MINLENFKEIFQHLKLNIEQNDKVNFLDLAIEYNHIGMNPIICQMIIIFLKTKNYFIKKLSLYY